MSSDLSQIALLIDGDNKKPTDFGRMLAWASKHGIVEIRRIYATPAYLSKWEGCIKHHGIEPVPYNINGKNVADVILIIHAVEILCSEKKIDKFCIIASDNDFTGLANWLHGEGISVVGIGGKNTPTSSFANECDDFVYVEDLPQSNNPDLDAQAALSGWKDPVKDAIGTFAEEDGWALLSSVGDYLKHIERGLDYHAYCYKDLMRLLQSCPEEFEIGTEFNRARLRQQ